MDKVRPDSRENRTNKLATVGNLHFAINSILQENHHKLQAHHIIYVRRIYLRMPYLAQCEEVGWHTDFIFQGLLSHFLLVNSMTKQITVSTWPGVYTTWIFGITNHWGKHPGLYPHCGQLVGVISFSLSFSESIVIKNSIEIDIVSCLAINVNFQHGYDMKQSWYSLILRFLKRP